MRRGLRTGAFFVISSVTFCGEGGWTQCASWLPRSGALGFRRQLYTLVVVHSSQTEVASTLHRPHSTPPRPYHYCSFYFLLLLFCNSGRTPKPNSFSIPKSYPMHQQQLFLKPVRGKLKLKSSERVGRRRRIPEVCSLPPWQKGNWEKERNWAVALGPHLRNSALMSARPLQRTVLIFAPFLGF
ncbi:hypothetical protein CDAR_34611 [Caerostris darwini]|uniref:Secreted protein n=1 Tax=Caerostris darwini TaxID=1538125 RepID=A0AAV4QEL1_9ARAC|nr:hypothetical protein CDAR_34611 [Caerostris darwini]